ncbi:MAG: Na+/H+ antiporter subunit E [Candidatus Omnitrophota bacterium]|nr:Na+/H+ antiporter subunit E [Candidatus Omnitrophota bacterium]
MAANVLTITLRTVVLFMFWIFFSGKIDATHLLMGLVSSLAIAIGSLDSESEPLSPEAAMRLPERILRGIAYSFWLLGRILTAAWHVSKIVLSPEMPIKPKFIKHKTTLKGEYGRVIFANSITLTPGTITADMEDGELLIHQLDDDSSEDIRSGALEKEIHKIFKDG